MVARWTIRSDQPTSLDWHDKPGLTADVVAMRFSLRRLPVATVLCAAAFAARPDRSVAATLARPFGSAMVLPMDCDVPVWGTAVAGAEVRVGFAGQEVTAKADASGEWKVVLKPMPASAEGKTLTVRAGKNENLIIDDVLVGRVFLCSGQSNMDFPLARAIGGKAEAAAAGKWAEIRLLNLSGAPTGDQVYSEEILKRLNPRDHFAGVWRRASPQSAAEFSAVAWWAGKAIHQAKRVPVGLVENAVGGSGAEAWLPRESLEARREHAELLGCGWLQSERIGAWARGRAARNLGKHRSANHPFRPGFLFESGIRWWRDFPFDGVLWYQGETNAEIADDRWNERLIEDLVAGWRAAFERNDLPFFMVQLPRIGGNDPLRAHWPAFREVQARVAKRLPGVHLIVTSDLGWDSPDVHPPDKLPVAQRMAAAILANPTSTP
jgi:sialate O-acetylesterase